MSKSQQRSRPIIPTLVVAVGLAVGIAGLVMFVLGIGTNAPFQFQIPQINLTIRSTDGAIIVMIIGFATAVIPTTVGILVDLARARRSDWPVEEHKPYVPEIFQGQPIVSRSSVDSAIEPTENRTNGG